MLWGHPQSQITNMHHSVTKRPIGIETFKIYQSNYLIQHEIDASFAKVNKD